MRMSVQSYPSDDIENDFRIDIPLEKTFPFQSKYFQYRGFPELPRTPHVPLTRKEYEGSNSSSVVQNHQGPLRLKGMRLLLRSFYF